MTVHVPRLLCFALLCFPVLCFALAMLSLPRLASLRRQVDGLAVVSSFVLTPYTAFWQPNQPTYNPVEACFQLTHPQINGGEEPYYESPRFLVDGSMTVRCLK